MGGGPPQAADAHVSFTQPICRTCWEQRNVGRDPIRVREPPGEKCCYCGAETFEGIYVRVDPRQVPYPSRDERSDSVKSELA